MPNILKLVFTLAVLWSAVYSVSYAAFQLKNKKHKSGISTLVLVLIMLAAFTLSGILQVYP